MPEHTLHYSQTLEFPRSCVFEFFAEAANLGTITPPELEFVILSKLPLEMKEGAEIAYRLKLFGVPFSWKSRIIAWSPPDFFVDEQVEGPYRLWIHKHSFRDGPNGTTIIDDDVRFRLPVAPMGEAAYPIVRKQLERIFIYRQQAVRSILLQKQGIK
ncbi:SRPBCC domain protein [Geotalea daltonii FRC-32]|uniref:SRPBCC domain protein n=1 Tax=Geotalea daltonii (strain DSM 22248 / JCM 15807 / FRC-32) TaxID=316067 RepID=B9M280_GEODF|nr:SRPBCC family protein [Geotalea daltonii]ACM21198.1 SRPBCC domain protein [Geotalea daltonii FRC-32]